MSIFLNDKLVVHWVWAAQRFRIPRNHVMILDHKKYSFHMAELVGNLPWSCFIKLWMNKQNYFKLKFLKKKLFSHCNAVLFSSVIFGSTFFLVFLYSPGSINAETNIAHINHINSEGFVFVEKRFLLLTKAS